MTDTPTAAPRTFEVRHVQIARAGFAIIATVMITFSTDHSAPVGLAVFSGFAIATGLVHLLAAWLVYAAGARWPSVLLGAVTLVAGMLAGIGPLRTTTGFLVIVIAWALVSGAIEAVAGWRALRGPRAAKAGDIEPWAGGPLTPDAPRSQARDALVVGILTIVLGIALLFVRASYALQYTIDEVGETFTLTGIIIAVGIFGGYAAVVGVYLAIAGFSPRAPLPVTTEAPASQNLKDHA